MALRKIILGVYLVWNIEATGYCFSSHANNDISRLVFITLYKPLRENQKSPLWSSVHCRWWSPLSDTWGSPPSPETRSGWRPDTAAAGRPLKVAGYSFLDKNVFGGERELHISLISPIGVCGHINNRAPENKPSIQEGDTLLSCTAIILQVIKVLLEVFTQ